MIVAIRVHCTYCKSVFNLLTDIFFVLSSTFFALKQFKVIYNIYTIFSDTTLGAYHIYWFRVTSYATVINEENNIFHLFGTLCILQSWNILGIYDIVCFSLFWLSRYVIPLITVNEYIKEGFTAHKDCLVRNTNKTEIELIFTNGIIWQPCFEMKWTQVCYINVDRPAINNTFKEDRTSVLHKSDKTTSEPSISGVNPSSCAPNIDYQQSSLIAIVESIRQEKPDWNWMSYAVDKFKNQRDNWTTEGPRTRPPSYPNTWLYSLTQCMGGRQPVHSRQLITKNTPSMDYNKNNAKSYPEQLEKTIRTFHPNIISTSVPVARTFVSNVRNRKKANTDQMCPVFDTNVVEILDNNAHCDKDNTTSKPFGDANGTDARIHKIAKHTRNIQQAESGLQDSHILTNQKQEKNKNSHHGSNQYHKDTAYQEWNKERMPRRRKIGLFRKPKSEELLIKHKKKKTTNNKIRSFPAITKTRNFITKKVVCHINKTRVVSSASRSIVASQIHEHRNYLTTPRKEKSTKKAIRVTQRQNTNSTPFVNTRVESVRIVPIEVGFVNRDNNCARQNDDIEYPRESYRAEENLGEIAIRRVDVPAIPRYTEAVGQIYNYVIQTIQENEIGEIVSVREALIPSTVYQFYIDTLRAVNQNSNESRIVRPIYNTVRQRFGDLFLPTSVGRLYVESRRTFEAFEGGQIYDIVRQNVLIANHIANTPDLNYTHATVVLPLLEAPTSGVDVIPVPVLLLRVVSVSNEMFDEIIYP